MNIQCMNCEYGNICTNCMYNDEQIKFGKAKNSAPFPSMVVVFRPKMEMLEGME